MKIVNCPVSHFRGHVVLHDPLTLLQLEAFERAAADVRRTQNEEIPSIAAIQRAILPGIIACVKEWHLRNLEQGQLSADSFPGTPRQAVSELLSWLSNEIAEICNGETEIPNA